MATDAGSDTIGHPCIPTRMQQYAPYPDALHALVQRLRFKPGWSFRLEEVRRDRPTSHGDAAGGLTLSIYVQGPNSYAEHETIGVVHYFIVPAATYDARAWQRWLLECCLKVEVHEACEFFRIDDHRPYAPNHGPGRDPYTVVERGTEEDARMLTSGAPNPNGDAV